MTKDSKKVAAGKARAKTFTREHQSMAGKARAAQFTTAYQRFAASCSQVAHAEYRRNHPTEIERRMIAVLEGLGWIENRDYKREKIIAGWWCDFVLESRRAIIEVNGAVWHSNGFHGEDRIARDARKREDLRVYGWRLLEISDNQMKDTRQVEAKIVQFLTGGH